MLDCDTTLLELFLINGLWKSDYHALGLASLILEALFISSAFHFTTQCHAGASFLDIICVAAASTPSTK